MTPYIAAREGEGTGRAVLKAALLAAALLASGCGLERVRLEVTAPGALSADLVLCGQARGGLKQQGDRFTLDLPADCEGEGAITVRYPDRPPVVCPIGYVTPNLDQSFRFEAEGGQCRPTDPEADRG